MADLVAPAAFVDHGRGVCVTAPEIIGLVGGIIGIVAGALSIETRFRQRALDRSQRTMADALSIQLDHVGDLAPPMPTRFPGFRPIGDIEHITIRLFGAGNPTTLDNFPVMMNGCSQGAWTMRWRALGNTAILIYHASHSFDPSAPGDHDNLTEPVASGQAGRVEGTICDQPVLMFDPASRGPSTLVDVTIEIQRWTAAP